MSPNRRELSGFVVAMGRGVAHASGRGAEASHARLKVLEAVMKRLPHYIAGERVSGETSRVGPVFNPATGRQTAKVAFATSAEVDRAVAAAAAAFQAWRTVPLSQRAQVMFQARELFQQHRRELAAAITAEHGKTLADAEGEVARAIENIEFACGIPQALKGEFSEQVSGGIDVFSVRQPLGVVAGVTPFNFPVMVPLWMAANAIACGNTFVLKPSEVDPSPSLLIADLLARAELPAGVFNVVQGDRVAVERLLEHPDVAALSFVGSTAVARQVYETGTRHGKRVQALGGAKNHMVVLPDADIDVAADAAVSAAYGSAGERCMAVSVVVAVGTVADPLVEAIATRVEAVRVGPGIDPACEMGPLVTDRHRSRVTGYIASAEREGACIVVDGREARLPADGFFLGPTLLDRVEPSMAVYRDEVFGPVLCVVRVEGFDDALRTVNANPYGNGVALFTRDGGAARRFQADVEVGMVGINVPIPVPVAYYSFGGWKASLFGDAHMYGPEGVRFYTRVKVVTSRWPAPLSGGVNLAFPKVE